MRQSTFGIIQKTTDESHWTASPKRVVIPKRPTYGGHHAMSLSVRQKIRIRELWGACSLKLVFVTNVIAHFSPATPRELAFRFFFTHATRLKLCANSRRNKTHPYRLCRVELNYPSLILVNPFAYKLGCPGRPVFVGLLMDELWKVWQLIFSNLLKWSPLCAAWMRKPAVCNPASTLLYAPRVYLFLTAQIKRILMVML